MVRPRAVREYSTRGGTSRYTSRWTSPSRSSSRKCGDSGVGAATATIGLIGAGNIGSTVAKLAVDAGYDVILSNSRGPETLSDLVEQPRRPKPPRPVTSSW
jgi:phosphoglycerate dehydrogenase-like enzyme